MLNIAFGQSKYYIDSLSENVRRGLRQKVRRGEYPGPAPIGYINNPRTKTVVVDRKKAKIIKQTFELYAQNNSCLENIANFLAQNGILRRSGKIWHKDRVKYLLTNPFYYGHFRYAKEVYEGKHEPIIAKKLFEAWKKFVCPIPLDEYRVRDTLLICFSWCSDSKYNRGCCHFFAS